MEPETLTLRGDLITAAQLAAAWGVTSATVSNYVKKGMPVAGTGRHGRVFDLNACGVWRANFTGSMHGGKRDGAGRKDGNLVPGADHEKDLLDQTDQSRTLTNADVLDLDDPHSVMRSFRSGKITPAIALTGKNVVELATKRLELERLIGKVVDRTAAASMFGVHLRNVRLTLETIPRRAAMQAATRLRLSAESAALVRGIIEEELARAMRMLGENPLEAPAVAAAG